MEDKYEVKDDSNGKFYFKNGNFHRVDGPAYESYYGTKFWYKEGKHHRLDGPAVEYFDGYKYWYYEGKKIDCDNQKDFERIINLQLFI